MSGLNWIHETYIVEVWVHFEEVFSEVLRCLKILKISGDIVAWHEFLTFLSVSVIF